MADKIQFVRNYSDLSTNKGFQFEFYCDRCGSGFRTRFKPSVTGTVTGVLDAAGSLLGGIFSSAADVSERVRSASWERAHDEAFAAATEELRPDFVQCPRCSSWVCRSGCWNTKRDCVKNVPLIWELKWPQLKPANQSKKYGHTLPWPKRIKS